MSGMSISVPVKTRTYDLVIKTRTYDLVGKTQVQILKEVARDGTFYKFYEEFLKQNNVKVVKTDEKSHNSYVYSVSMKNNFIGTVYKRSSDRWVNSIELNSRPGCWRMRDAVLNMVFYTMGIPIGEKVRRIYV